MRVGSVGIIGYGNFGAFLHVLLKRFAPQITVRVFTPEKKPDGATFFSMEEAAVSDVVVLAVPISEFENVLEDVLPHVKETSVIVDVATVKMHTADVLKRLAPHRSYIATHPIFGPESYAKREGNVSGFRVVITDHTLSKDVYKATVSFLRKTGFAVIEVSADEHDKRLAQTLFLTHFIGQTITEAEFDRTDIDSVSFGFLMDAVESVKHDKQLFQDVYRYNPHCKATLDRFEKAEANVRRMLDKS
ncbi:MAG: putative prephenate dehydrogenase [Parcubacteria group bacterium Gr01-1014_8]|nr:MAG: putative prephenate dehydrogenase [Parcubacteria group bacterium Gr01-1014_8]